MGVTYILKLGFPLGSPNHRAQYYCGSTKNLKLRMEHHRAGRGAKFTAAAVERGIDFKIAEFWIFPTLAEAREFEQRIKRSKNYSRFLNK